KPDERFSGMDEMLTALKEASEGIGRVSQSRSLELSGETSHSGLESHSGAFDVVSASGTPSQGRPIMPAAVEAPPSHRGKIVAAVAALAIVGGGVAARVTKRAPAPAPQVATAPAAPVPAPAPAQAPTQAAGAPVVGTLLVHLRSVPDGAMVVVGERTYGPT